MNVTEALIADIVHRVMEAGDFLQGDQPFKKERDPSGITHIQVRTGRVRRGRGYTLYPQRQPYSFSFARQGAFCLFCLSGGLAMTNRILVLQLHQAAADLLKNNIDMVLSESPGAVHTPPCRMFG